jgi:hypothetical protein
MWMMKMDSAGVMEWQKTYGVSSWDSVEDMQQTADGGFIMTGGSRVIKLNQDGTLSWQKTYGIQLYSICQTVDGGYIAAGNSCVVKLQANGTVAWAKKYSGAPNYTRVRQTSDGGYIITGRIEPIGSNIVGFVVLKIAASGDRIWQKSFGSSLSDYAYAAVESADGGYIAVGTTNSGVDMLAVKLAADGDIVWQRVLNRKYTDKAYAVAASADGGCVIAGYSSIGVRHEDVVLLKLTADGSLAWQKRYGSSVRYMGRSIAVAADGGYILGCTVSNSGAIYEDIVITGLCQVAASCKTVILP